MTNLSDKNWYRARRELWLCIGYEIFYQRLCGLADKLGSPRPTRVEFVGKVAGRSTGLPMIRMQLLRNWPPYAIDGDTDSITVH